MSAPSNPPLNQWDYRALLGFQTTIQDECNDCKYFIENFHPCYDNKCTCKYREIILIFWTSDEKPKTIPNETLYYVVAKYSSEWHDSIEGALNTSDKELISTSFDMRQPNPKIILDAFKKIDFDDVTDLIGNLKDNNWVDSYRLALIEAFEIKLPVIQEKKENPHMRKRKRKKRKN